MLGRLLAAISYCGLAGALVPLAQPDNPFVVRHARRGVLLHLLRIALIAPALALPLLGLSGPAAASGLTAFAGNLSLLVLLGFPSVAVIEGPNGLWIIGALLVTWGLQFLGVLLALGGLTADLEAFLHADWPNRPEPGGDASERRRAPDREPDREKEELTRLRETRLARVRAADTVAARERRRNQSLTDLREEFVAASARRAHLTHLLAVGEIGERRYAVVTGEIDRLLATLSTEIAVLGARRVAVAERDGRHQRELPTDLIVQAPLRTLAISGLSGIPLRTYGAFPLDEVLVAGILSAFNSLSEEVFGAQVHKTHLAEGQVLYFVHARWTVTLAVFAEEPPPAQLRRLRDLVNEFERVNSRELSRPAPNAARLQEVPVPFSFIEEAG